MPRRALLIGYTAFLGQSEGRLDGASRDLQRMKAWLEGQGFAGTLCWGRDATRAGILAALDDLVDEAEEGDAVAIYYTGHGSYVESSPRPGVAKAPRYPFILPVDFHVSTCEDFRGILAYELSLRLKRLTAVTRNVTLLLDCCFAGGIWRADLRPKSQPPWRKSLLPWLTSMSRLKQELEDAGAFQGLPAEGNPFAVRLTAAGPNQSAYELGDGRGNAGSVFTDALLQVLEETAGLPVSWAGVGRRTRELVLKRIRAHWPQLVRFPELAQRPELADRPDFVQRPEFEGPVDRLLFRLERVERRGVLGYALVGGRPALRGGRLCGVRVDEVYGLMPLGAERHEPALELARLRVTGVTGAVAWVEVLDGGEPAELLLGAPAFPLERRAPAQGVDVQGEEARAAPLREFIAQVPGLRCDPGEPGRAPLARVIAGEEGVELRTGDDQLLRLGLTPPELAGDLQRLAHARALRELAGGSGDEALQTPYQLEWGRVAGGQPCLFTEDLPLVHRGDAIFLRVRRTDPRGSRTADRLFVSVFHVRLDGAVVLLTTSEPSGVEVSPGREYVLGRALHRGLPGLTIGWPTAIPASRPRPEHLVVVLTDAALDLRPLESRGVGASATAPREERPPRFHRAGAPARREDLLRYAVVHFPFLLHPAPARRGPGPSFRVDVSPAAAAPPEDALPPGTRLRLQLHELHIPALRMAHPFRRLDWMACWNHPETGAFRFVARTLALDEERDGSRHARPAFLCELPAPAELLVCLWVSSRRDATPLEELIAGELGPGELEELSAEAGGLSPRGARLARVAHDALQRSDDELLPSYRALLAPQVRRCPPEGLSQAGPVRLAFALERVAAGAPGAT